MIKPVAIGPIDGVEHVGAVAAAADGEEQVALGAVVHELLNENLVVAAVVADGQDPAGVVGQAEDFEALFRFVLEVFGRSELLPRSSAMWLAVVPLPPLPMMKTKRPFFQAS